MTTLFACRYSICWTPSPLSTYRMWRQHLRCCLLLDTTTLPQQGYVMRDLQRGWRTPEEWNCSVRHVQAGGQQWVWLVAGEQLGILGDRTGKGGPMINPFRYSCCVPKGSRFSSDLAHRSAVALICTPIRSCSYLPMPRRKNVMYLDPHHSFGRQIIRPSVIAPHDGHRKLIHEDEL